MPGLERGHWREGEELPMGTTKACRHSACAVTDGRKALSREGWIGLFLCHMLVVSSIMAGTKNGGQWADGSGHSEVTFETRRRPGKISRSSSRGMPDAAPISPITYGESNEEEAK